MLLFNYYTNSFPANTKVRLHDLSQIINKLVFIIINNSWSKTKFHTGVEKLAEGFSTCFAFENIILNHNLKNTDGFYN